MADHMGFFDFIKSKPKSSKDILLNRWKITSNGTYADRYRQDEIAWRVFANSFEIWFQGIEQRTGQSLGRRLAHASAESEEFLLSIGGVLAKPRGRVPSNWIGASKDWSSRGLGKIQLLEDDDEIRLIVNNHPNGPLCAGSLAANWECGTGQRHRFRWSESVGQGLVVDLTLDDVIIPKGKKSELIWRDLSTSTIITEEGQDAFADLEFLDSGYWTIMGRRSLFIHRDLLLKFEEYCLPYLDEIHEGRSDYTWNGLDEDRALWWTAMADSIREIFYSAGHHIFVSKTEDWLRIAHRHLSHDGLGKISSVSMSDNNGGVEFTIDNTLHPALLSGTLLGCWERAYGRRGKVILNQQSSGLKLKILSLNEIAE
ncbi:MAG: hypothetical protein HN534_02805 [Euryarchaeota archaeon]|jgi:hypothetical protein|nr:hypothetical protein [Euryarchaeota archaeon]MBT3653845.1 hypothetical protein [Euryarchaeota archaeon]MBT3757179.1 hypothetical protein [Euryarchaeota archaeon]MBT4050193.1 hypothetical protein [Euryarchaeota archaeon]MBT4347044.1 hypothetical protein [Euryarchaeota archaeon]|tara:strand:- start:4838 stop:5947 length:1110 start_codon:yes stop_codon:yes gene_type:complete